MASSNALMVCMEPLSSCYLLDDKRSAKRYDSGMNKLWQPLIEFGPLAGFFLAYKFSGLMSATVTIILLTLAALLASYLKDRRLAVTPLISAILVSLLGGLTLALHDDFFIKIKPTLVNGMFATILLFGWWRGRGLLQHVMGKAIPLSQAGWLALSRNYGVFFLVLAGVNEVIWRNYSTDFWVNFKVFGMLSSTMLFSLCQLFAMRGHFIDTDEHSA